MVLHVLGAPCIRNAASSANKSSIIVAKPPSSITIPGWMKALPRSCTISSRSFRRIQSFPDVLDIPPHIPVDHVPSRRSKERVVGFDRSSLTCNDQSQNIAVIGYRCFSFRSSRSWRSRAIKRCVVLSEMSPAAILARWLLSWSGRFAISVPEGLLSCLPEIQRGVRASLADMPLGCPLPSSRNCRGPRISTQYVPVDARPNAHCPSAEEASRDDPV